MVRDMETTRVWVGLRLGLMVKVRVRVGKDYG
jgi:hypothetical protein